MVGYKSSSEGSTAEVYFRSGQDKKVTGVAILVTDPREFTVVNLAGTIDLDSLADLGGHFGVPKIEGQKQRRME
jgi:hypothetical protein